MILALLWSLMTLKPATWEINQNNSLIWDGKPYLPVGVKIEGTPANVDQVSQAGIKNVILELPADGLKWTETFKACDERGINYVVSLNTLGAAKDAVIVDPAGYRVPDIIRKMRVDLLIPEASEALLVLANNRDGLVRWSKRVQIVNGRFNETIDPQVELPHTLLVFPIVRSQEAPDFFEGLDEYRDKLLTSFMKNPPGGGYRGLIDPLGARSQFPGSDSQFVPQSRMFQSELSKALETKYASLSTALKSWGVSANDIKDFDSMARLVPLWTESRGVQMLWDTKGDQLYAVDRKNSMAWLDIRSSLRQVAATRTKNLVENIKAQTKAPVFFSWVNWDCPAGVKEMPIDGISVELPTDSVNSLVAECAKPISQILRRGQPGLLIANDLVIKEGGLSLEAIVEECESLGVRSWFFRTSNPAQLTEIGKLCQAREADTSASEWKIQPLFYPQVATDPAVPMRLKGGFWWLPSDASGQRCLLGAGIEGYRDTSEQVPKFVLWATGPTRKVTLRVSDPKKLVVTTLEGEVVPFKVKKNDVELEMVGSPMVFKGVEDIPIPMPSFTETADMIQFLLDSFENLANPSGNEQFIYADTVKAFDRSPGASMDTLQAQLNRMLPKTAPFVWIACSRSPKHNFSDTISGTGSASESVLAVSSRFTPENGVFVAEFPLSTKQQGSYEVWLAAQIPTDLRDQVRIRAGDRVLGPPAAPVSFYGDGYAWYKFGSIDLPRAITNFRFECPSNGKTKLALDLIHLATPGFRPEGPRIPKDWLRQLMAIKATKSKKGSGGR